MDRSNGFVCVIDQTYFRHSDHHFNISNSFTPTFFRTSPFIPKTVAEAALIQTASPKMMWRVTIASRRHIPLFPDRMQPELADPQAKFRISFVHTFMVAK